MVIALSRKENPMNHTDKIEKFKAYLIQEMEKYPDSETSRKSIGEALETVFHHTGFLDIEKYIKAMINHISDKLSESKIPERRDEILAEKIALAKALFYWTNCS